MQEKRSHKRLDIDVFLILKNIDATHSTDKEVEVSVEITDISRNGLGFITDVILDIHSFYDVKLQLWTKEILPLVIDIVRSDVRPNGLYKYGASFVGMMESEALKIDIYDMIQEKEHV